MHRQEMKYIYGKKINKSEPQTLVDQRKIIGNKLNFASREAYKLLRTNLIFSMCDEDKCKIIGITSALRGEGKSTTAINLAYSLAEANQKTLLIEADMRLPLVHRLLQLDKTVGLSNVLAGVAKLEDAVRHGILLYTLSVLPSGDIPPNPSELLSSSRMKNIISKLSDEYDYIIIDLPPVTAVSDGLAIANLLSGMLVVVRHDYCDRRALAAAMQQMDFLKVKILGFVMNCKERQRKKRDRYYSKYRYSSAYKPV